MIFLSTHGDDDRVYEHDNRTFVKENASPVHTDMGWVKLGLMKDLLAGFGFYNDIKIGYIVSSVGERFHQMGSYIIDNLNPTQCLPFLTAVPDPVLGGYEIIINHAGTNVLHTNFATYYGKGSFRTFSDNPHYCKMIWKTMRDYERLAQKKGGNTALVFAGRQIVLALNRYAKVRYEGSTKACMFEINPQRRSIKCLIKNGELNQTPLE